ERTGKGDRLDAAGARSAKSARGGRGGGAGRVDVVDHGDSAGSSAGRAEGSAHGPALGSRAATLAAAARPVEQRQARKLPRCRELEREPLRRVVPALQAPRAELTPAAVADDAALRQEQVEHLRTLGAEP